jgi:CIC family chloride channel protein
MEYTFTGFAPVILAAVSATVLTRSVFGAAPAFTVPALDMGSITELPVVVVMGVVIGALATLFVRTLQGSSHLSRRLPPWLRTTAGGLAVGVCALVYPQVMGVGYDTVNQALLGQFGLALLAGVTIVKLAATAVGLGCGLPGGLIGPTLFIGATAGGAVGLIAAATVPGEVASPGFYATVGMGAMMAATLHAPLAALMAMLELTANPNIILPGMLAVIAATLVNSELFKQAPVYLVMIRALGLDYRNDPLAQSLRRIGVTRVMDTRFVTAPRNLSRADADARLKKKPQWIIVEETDEPAALLSPGDLARYLGDHGEASDTIDLLEIPAQRLELTAVHLQASLQEALEALRKNQAEALYVTHKTRDRKRRIYGVLTAHDIERSYGGT